MNDHASQAATLERPSIEELRRRIIEAIRQVYDPEIPVNLYDLGLIYDIRIDEDYQVHVAMTLTAPSCPVAGSLPEQVAAVVREVHGVSEACVNLVWDPPWDPARMSDEAKLQLGLY